LNIASNQPIEFQRILSSKTTARLKDLTGSSSRHFYVTYIRGFEKIMETGSGNSASPTSSIESPSDKNAQGKRPKFKRNYMACLNCRIRKVKCDLGDVNSPHSPPCARCKRERKECIFVERKKGGTRGKPVTKRRKLLEEVGKNYVTPSGIRSIDSNSINQSKNNSSQLSREAFSVGSTADTYAPSLAQIPASGYNPPQIQAQPQQVSYPSLAGSSVFSTGNQMPYIPNTAHVIPTSTTSHMGSQLPSMLPPPNKITRAQFATNEVPYNPAGNSISQVSVENIRKQNFNLPANPSVPEIGSGTPATSTETSKVHTLPLQSEEVKFARDDAGGSFGSTLGSPQSQVQAPTSQTNRERIYSDQPLTNNATMVFLAHIAGKIARADKRDRIDGKEKVEELEAAIPSSVEAKRKSILKSRENSTTRRNSDLYNSRSSLSRESSYIESPLTSSSSSLPKETFGHASELFPSIRQDRYEMPPIKSTLSMRLSPTAKLSDIEYIGPDGIMTEKEARTLIELFFTTMHPFFPYIPEELHNPDILPGYPMLLCAILTVAARYHQLPFESEELKKELSKTSEHNVGDDKNLSSDLGDNKNVRHLKVHEQLWIYCQRLFSMTVWGESSSRSIGTLLSFLLFTEWNPRAIHFRWSDYANSAEDESGQQEEYAGLSAMKRSELMSFMLVGTANRLSILLPDHPLTFLATHVAETHAAIGLNKRSMLAQTLAEVDVNSQKWGFTQVQKGTLELLQFFSLCYETLYGQHPKFGHLNKYQNLAILDILSPILENWYQKYHRILKPSNPHSVNFGHQASKPQDQINWLLLSEKCRHDLSLMIERESLILDYYYTKLYLYSLALSGDTSVSANLANSKKGRSLRLDELVRYSRYVELAYKAAKEVLAVTQRVHRLKLLKFMPVRWVTRIIKAVSFIVKCYLTLTTDTTASQKSRRNLSFDESDELKIGGEQSAILQMSVIPVEEIVSLLQKTAICLRDAAPDELHLSTRYSTILMYLCSQFKSRMRDHRERLVVDYESQIRDKERREAGMMAESTGNFHQDESNLPLHQVGGSNRPGRPIDMNLKGYPFAPSGPPHTKHMNSQAQQKRSGSISTPSSSIGVVESGTPIPANGNSNFSADQQLFDEYFSNTNPSETLFTWFASNNSPGLDFVDQFTKEMEMEFINKGGENLKKQHGKRPQDDASADRAGYPMEGSSETTK